ncbi:MFS transporter [Pantoea sp. B9002]|uniref:MFS transporter n=1 Tax=Pantoea sp. B9002 TaxID=2726979 RepID=UPI0015A0ACBA|nr:MFS transporter [Pantoea sp. B9002]NWA62897.1 MFS transporter [Pantoea sp. B9002]
MHTDNRPTRVRWTLFFIIFALVVINLIDRVSLSIAMPTIAAEFNLSPTLQGVILSCFFWAYALLQLPGGWLIDRYGPRRMITFSTFFWGIFQTLAALATGGISLLLSRVMLGAAEAPLFPAGGKLNAMWLSANERGRGAVLMDCGGPIGAALGGLIIAHLIVMLGSWRLVFAITGVATLLMSWVAWRWLRDDPAQHPEVNTAERALIAAGAQPAEVAAGPVTRGFGIAKPMLMAMLTGRAAWAMMFFGLLTWGPSYLAHARGFDLIAIGNATFIIFLCGAVGSLSGGFLLDALVKRGMKHGRALKGLLAISGTVALVAFLSLPYLRSPIAAVAVLCIAAFFLMWGSLYWSLPALLTTKEKMGLAGGAMNMAGSVGGIVVPLLVGIMLQLGVHYDSIPLFFAGCSAVYVLGTALIGIQQRAEVTTCITVR